MTDDPKQILEKVLQVWTAAFNDHRAEEVVALFSDRAMFQGFDPVLRTRHTEIRDYYRAIDHDASAKVKALNATQLAEGLIAGFADVTFSHPNRSPVLARFSLVLQRVGGDWLIVNYHAAPRFPANGL